MTGFTVDVEEYETILRNAEASIRYTIELVERGLQIEIQNTPWYKRIFRCPRPAETPARSLERVLEMLERLETWKMECPDLECVVVPAWPDPHFVEWENLVKNYRSISTRPPSA